MWTVASNHHPDKPGVAQAVYEKTALIFEEDKVVIEAQYRNMLRYPGASGHRVPGQGVRAVHGGRQLVGAGAAGALRSASAAVPSS
jgi:hypothetical protein